MDDKDALVEAIAAKVRAEMKEEFSAFRESAFPAGDIEGHRRYHATLIDINEQRLKLRQAIIEKTLSGLIWSGIVGAAYVVWEWLKREITR